MCPHHLQLYLAVPHQHQQIAVARELRLVAAHMAIVPRCQTAIAMVSGGYAAGLAAAAGACQGVLRLRDLGVDCGSERHRVSIAAAAGAAAEGVAGVVQVCCQVVGSVVLGEARTGAVPHQVVEDSAAAVDVVADAQEEIAEVVDRIGLPVEAQSTVVDLVIVGLLRVRTRFESLG
jgi:hypothetical protein